VNRTFITAVTLQVDNAPYITAVTMTLTFTMSPQSSNGFVCFANTFG